jgi:hypothetical protein
MSVKYIDELERKITAAMNQIKEGTKTPKDSNIGMLLGKLKPVDEALHEKLVEKYKVVFAAWKKNN